MGAIAHDLRTPPTRLAFPLDDLPAPLGDKVDADILDMKSMLTAALDLIVTAPLTAAVNRWTSGCWWKASAKLHCTNRANLPGGPPGGGSPPTIESTAGRFEPGAARASQPQRSRRREGGAWQTEPRPESAGVCGLAAPKRPILDLPTPGRSIDRTSPGKPRHVSKPCSYHRETNGGGNAAPPRTRSADDAGDQTGHVSAAPISPIWMGKVK